MSKTKNKLNKDDFKDIINLFNLNFDDDDFSLTTFKKVRINLQRLESDKWLFAMDHLNNFDKPRSCPVQAIFTHKTKECYLQLLEKAFKLLNSEAGRNLSNLYASIDMSRKNPVWTPTCVTLNHYTNSNKNNFEVRDN